MGLSGRTPGHLARSNSHATETQPNITPGSACLPHVAHAPACASRYNMVHGTHQGAGSSIVYLKNLTMAPARKGDLKRVIMLNQMKEQLRWRRGSACTRPASRAAWHEERVVSSMCESGCGKK
jgi:hypothetical protein